MWSTYICQYSLIAYAFQYLQASRPYILSYFNKYRRDCAVYGFLPVISVCSDTAEGELAILSPENMDIFFNQIDLRALLRDVWEHCEFGKSSGTICDILPGCRSHLPDTSTSKDLMMDLQKFDQVARNIKRIRENTFNVPSVTNIVMQGPHAGVAGEHDTFSSSNKKQKFQTREEIQALALQMGAKGG